MSDAYARDLERWMPRLIAVWRAQRKQKGSAELPETRLTPQEVREVAAGVKQLSMGLTRERQLAGARYMDDPKLLGAYLLFYWPVSYAQARQALGELPSRPRSVLDLGSGPGPLAFAAMDAGASEVTAADRSKPALTLARALALEAGEALATRDWDPLKKSPLPEGQFDLITLGHVLNELYGTGDGATNPRAALLESVLERVKKGGSLLILEPALRETSRGLLKVRDVLVAKGYAVRAPCMFRGPCQALVKETDWCHAERAWPMPRVVEELARAASLHKESLKMSYLVLAPKGEAWAEPPSGRLFRIVSESLEGKGRQRYMGCGPEGRVGLALQERHKNEQNAPFFKLQRGDVISVTETEPKGDGLGLSDKSEVRVVAPAGRGVPPFKP
ncbi:methyltransferase domain-containing protein [Aggregicoccus sp. 17bor-14]|uniref:small ribosomal subunit Rsm22 family protein n=1 Tax=Myxococcaceae TaxID=31 RepID=UPI00129C3A85|nr:MULTISPECIES: small ribosomal subunit Rsm22 family protein [Myxococcaceae]MBF5042105.1 methyltransferase domain-containing protein [Simulacricoccus sp. 17bor-14]MRI87882.1 methyltransferase domain-containing protein [Aggregicoccus sp. 17bor-14]